MDSRGNLKARAEQRKRQLESKKERQRKKRRAQRLEKQEREVSLALDLLAEYSSSDDEPTPFNLDNPESPSDNEVGQEESHDTASHSPASYDDQNRGHNDTSDPSTSNVLPSILDEFDGTVGHACAGGAGVTANIDPLTYFNYTSEESSDDDFL